MTCIVPTCTSTTTRPYLRGHLCPDHAPHVPTPPPHGLTPQRPAAAAAGRPPAAAAPAKTWATREESTWIDKL